jgi:hypothetical protein
MKVWIFVEGVSDQNGLDALWKSWRQKLKQKRWGINVIQLHDKSRFFRKIGPRAVEKLLFDRNDLVVGLPDFYPNKPYSATKYSHATVDELISLQRRIVVGSLKEKSVDVDEFSQRFYPCALKHDLEMLMLASSIQLSAHLGTKKNLGKKWRHPVEEQDQDNPPKRIIESLYQEHKRRSYKETVDSVSVLSRVENIEQILYSKSGQLECPIFKNLLDWIGSKTGVPAY